MRKGEIKALARETARAMAEAGVGGDEAPSLALRHADAALRAEDLALAASYVRYARAGLVLQGVFTRVLESRGHALVA